MKQSNRFRQSLTFATELIHAQSTPLLMLLALTTLFTISSENLLQELAKGDDSSRWSLQIAMGLWDLFEGVVLILILSWGVPKVRALTEAHFKQHPFEEGYINNFLAEYLRLLANVLLWGLLLIIPGFLRYVRLVFVPYVALFARPYREGKRDALDLAADLTRGRYPRLLVLLGMFAAVQVLVEMAPHLEPQLHILPLRIVFIGISFFISVWLYAWLYLEFEQAMEEYKWT